MTQALVKIIMMMITTLMLVKMTPMLAMMMLMKFPWVPPLRTRTIVRFLLVLQEDCQWYAELIQIIKNAGSLIATRASASSIDTNPTAEVHRVVLHLIVFHFARPLARKVVATILMKEVHGHWH